MPPHERLTDVAVVPREKPHTGAAARPALAGEFFITSSTWEAQVGQGEVNLNECLIDSCRGDIAAERQAAFHSSGKSVPGRRHSSAKALRREGGDLREGMEELGTL